MIGLGSEILPIKLKKVQSTTVLSNKLVRYSLKTTNNQIIKAYIKILTYCTIAKTDLVRKNAS